MEDRLGLVAQGNLESIKIQTPNNKQFPISNPPPPILADQIPNGLSFGNCDLGFVCGLRFGIWVLIKLGYRAIGQTIGGLHTSPMLPPIFHTTSVVCLVKGTSSVDGYTRNSL